MKLLGVGEGIQDIAKRIYSSWRTACQSEMLDLAVWLRAIMKYSFQFSCCLPHLYHPKIQRQDDWQGTVTCKKSWSRKGKSPRVNQVELWVTWDGYPLTQWCQKHLYLNWKLHKVFLRGEQNTPVYFNPSLCFHLQSIRRLCLKNLLLLLHQIKAK